MIEVTFGALVLQGRGAARAPLVKRIYRCVAGIVAFLLSVRWTARTLPMTEPRNWVVQVSRFGGPDGLEVVDATTPTAGRGEVRVRVLASGLEYTDVLIRRHLYPQTMRRRPPFVLGYDVVGEIDQLGNDVSGFQLGDRVADMTVLGWNASYCTLRADRLTRVPTGARARNAETAAPTHWVHAGAAARSTPSGHRAAS